MAGTTRLLWTVLAGCLAANLAGCAPAVRAYRAPGPAVPPAATVAMVPLTNLTGVENAARLLTDQLVLEIGRLHLFQVQDPGVVLGALRKLRILTPDRISSEQMKSLAETVGTPYLLTGTVTQCTVGGEFSGQFPSAAVSLRLVDARDGQVLWAATQARAGNDRETVFGLGRVHRLEELSNRLARDLVRSMRDLMRPGPPLQGPRPMEASS